MTDTDIVAELRRLYADSTTDGDRSWVHGDVINERGCVLFSGRRCIEVGTIFTREDADLIIAMHEALPALLDAIEALRGLRQYPANTVSAEVYEMRLDAALAALERSSGE